MKSIINKGAIVPLAIALSDVGFDYRGTPVFRGLSLAVPAETLTAVIGPNGSGKSTLLCLLARVLRPDRGRVHVAADDVAFAVQRSEVTDDFPITVGEAVMMGRWRHLGLLRRPKATDRAVVDHWLTELGLADLRHRTLGELSGGQRQRVLLAQAFAQEAKLLLLDEPTTGLDATATELVLGHLNRMSAGGTTIVAATHDSRLIGAAPHLIDLGSADVARETESGTAVDSTSRSR